MKYYELHVFYSRQDGYSVALQTEKDLITEEDIIQEAITQNVFSDESDSNHVDYVSETTKDVYILLKG